MDILNKFRQLSLKAKLALVLCGIFVISTVIQVLFFRSSLPLGPVEAGKLQRWESSLGKFAIDYPENWTAHELPQGDHGDNEVIAVIVPRNNYLPQVYISRKIVSSQEIDDVVLWGETRNQSHSQFTSMKLDSFSANNVPEKIREYIFFSDSPLGAEKMHCLDLYALNNEIGYQFAFCAEESDWTKMSPVFQQMIESVEFNPK